jgi:hypothetical protein
VNRGPPPPRRRPSRGPSTAVRSLFRWCPSLCTCALPGEGNRGRDGPYRRIEERPYEAGRSSIGTTNGRRQRQRATLAPDDVRAPRLVRCASASPGRSESPRDRVADAPFSSIPSVSCTLLGVPLSPRKQPCLIDLTRGVRPLAEIAPMRRGRPSVCPSSRSASRWWDAIPRDRKARLDASLGAATGPYFGCLESGIDDLNENPNLSAGAC